MPKEFPKLRLKELKEGDSIYFIRNTPEYGTAEFEICPVWKRGRLVEIHIHPQQQPHAKEKFIVRNLNSDSITVESWIHKGVDPPRIWRHIWCKDHKTQCMNVYPPEGTSLLTLTHVGSTTTLTFEVARHGC